MAERTEHLEAVLLSAARPSQEQEKRFLAFLAEKYGEGTTLTWQKSDDYPGGFRLEVGAEVYDWSAGGRLSQFKDALEKLAATQGDVIPLLKETVLSWTPQAMAQEVGTVLTIGDGIARVDGLEGAAYGEVLLFDGGVRGMVQDLSEDSVGCILFDDDASVCAGSTVRRTGRTAGVPVGEGFLGRVVNALGVPIDGGGDIRADGYRAVESPAPGIIDRQSVDTPLETGILTVDSMFPIGRGQRELIIGDRQTGKTAVALDAILNQKVYNDAAGSDGLADEMRVVDWAYDNGPGAERIHIGDGIPAPAPAPAPLALLALGAAGLAATRRVGRRRAS